MVVPLKGIIERGMLEFANISISRFSCRDTDVETFIKDKAIDFERRNKSRTYLIIDDSNNTLLGYFTLSLKALQFGANVSKNTIKSIDGFSKDIRAVGITLIGQFGKDSELAKDIDGGTLFNICIETVYKAHKIVGGRFVMLECRDIENVVSFYKRHGFEPLQYDATDNYMQMIRRL